MCGISAIISLKDENILDLILSSIEELENRGYDSLGIGFINKNSTKIIKTLNKNNPSKEILNNINFNNFTSSLAIAHTRWATHGGINLNNCHPHTAQNNDITLVHNGIIENYLEIKKELLEEDYLFNSLTDSEVIAKLIAYYNYQEENIETAIDLMCKKIKGTYALAILYLPTNSIYLIKKGSPLLLGFNENIIIATSEISGFKSYIFDYFSLESETLYKISKEGYEIINKISPNLNTNLLKHNKNFEDSILSYKNYTEKEIFEQANSILNTLNQGGRIKNNIINFGGMNKIKNHFNSIENIILLGCGTSHNACLLAKIYFNKLNIFNTIQVYEGAEFASYHIPKNGKSLVFFASQSGETRDLYNAISICKDKKCICCGIINVVDSQIAMEMDCGIYLNCGKERAVASTKSFTSMILIFSLLAIYFEQNLNYENNIIIKKLISVRNLHNQINNLLQPNYLNKLNEVKELVIEKLCKESSNSIYILGKDTMFPIAKEACLKIKEICYIHAEAFEASNLKHGPLALIKDNTCCFLLINHTNKESILNCYHEIISRNGFCFIFTEIRELLELDNINTHVFLIEESYYCQEILFIIAFQYLAYILSIYKNINPDKPRNLAKVVTV